VTTNRLASRRGRSGTDWLRADRNAFPGVTDDGNQAT